MLKKKHSFRFLRRSLKEYILSVCLYLNSNSWNQAPVFAWHLANYVIWLIIYKLLWHLWQVVSSDKHGWNQSSLKSAKYQLQLIWYWDKCIPFFLTLLNTVCVVPMMLLDGGHIDLTVILTKQHLKLTGDLIIPPDHNVVPYLSW